MTQIDGLSESLAASSLRADDVADALGNQSSPKLAKVSFASALQKGQIPAPSILPRTATVMSPASSPPSTSAAVPSVDTSTPDAELAKVDDTILQAMRKRDDRIFFSQYENQMSGFVHDATRSTGQMLSGSMNRLKTGYCLCVLS